MDDDGWLVGCFVEDTQKEGFASVQKIEMENGVF